MLIPVALIAGLAAVIASAGSAFALDKVTFGLNWLADPEAGGYYQAVIDGTYAKYGLDVTIQPGRPESNGGMLLLAGKIDFFQGGDLLGDFLAEERHVPLVAVAADFQKDPQIFMSHPGVGLDKWTDLPKASTAFVSAGGLYSFYAWMVKAWGFRNSVVKPYDFDSAPFIVDKQSIQEGYLTSEPYAVEKQGHFKPNVFLLADYGYSTYSCLIEARRKTVEDNPDLVQRFVDASAIGWRHYLYGDNRQANEAIKRDNPVMTDGQIAYSIAKLKEYGIVDSGDAQRLGIGAMTDERVKNFFDEMVKAGIVPPDIDYRKVYTLRFVNKGVGVALGPGHRGPPTDEPEQAPARGH
ncbi:MAG TPA: ABC transporter substrate-binding protein [Roseiarcus sp.]|nr:ABC transporter substrate-binding protein [Roseiarcus sp.]